MSKLIMIFVVAGMAANAAAGEPTDNRELSAPAATGPTAQSATAPDGDLTAQERQARIEAALAQARLELVLSRKAWRAERLAEAAEKAQRVLDLLSDLPAEMDVSIYELQAEGVLAKVAHAGVEIIEPRTSAQPTREQRVLEEDYRDSEVQALLEAQETRIIPRDLITYPKDWSEITKRREQYSGGMVARGPSWWDDEGREWYVAIYDVHDLILEPARFRVPMFSYHTWRDREALRQYSYIFRGDAHDLAAGIPLLRYFGGVEDSMPELHYSRTKLEQITRMVEAFTNTPEGGAFVIPLMP